LKLKWDVKYDEALEIIDKKIKGLKKGGLYYLLMKKDTRKEVVKNLLKRKPSALSFYVFEGEKREEAMEILTLTVER
jgi:hypothetical protein